MKLTSNTSVRKLRPGDRRWIGLPARYTLSVHITARVYQSRRAERDILWITD